MQNILVIKLGALGDFIQALGPMAAIKRFHKDAKITLLTTKAFEGFAQECGYFDEIWIDKRPKWYDFSGWVLLKKQLRSGNFDRVYDLQNNDRSGLYFKLFSNTQKPEWVGVAKGASHRNTSPSRTTGHAFDGHVQTLALAGIKDIEIDTLDWMKADISAFDLRKPYVLLVPGSAPSRPEKRWPAQHYGALTRQLNDKGLQPIILGTDAEKDVADIISEHCDGALNLAGQTRIPHIVELAKHAAGAIGNDTGPMHLIAATGCPSLTVFSQHSNPVRHAPKGKNVAFIQEENLEDLDPELVMKAFEKIK